MTLISACLHKLSPLSELALDESVASKPSLKTTFIPATILGFVSPLLPKNQSPDSVTEMKDSLVKSNDTQAETESDEASKEVAIGSDSGKKASVVRKRKAGKAKK